ncbi:hypothetical protein M514_07727 [Trichuris suis]|uniref:Uncharacterized protein n=1 Tax=Trichuris suis TaxID=68888 RepID=A0A085M276_9BILA|nr:hypothetical protein M513_07727 [Trichuris suis]KFD60388.1 hypothetical protein M514_07727 [Trichuris suis]
MTPAYFCEFPTRFCSDVCLSPRGFHRLVMWPRHWFDEVKEMFLISVSQGGDFGPPVGDGSRGGDGKPMGRCRPGSCNL